MTVREKIAAVCAALVLGAAIGWGVSVMFVPSAPGPEIIPEIQDTGVDLSDEAWEKIEDLITGGEK